MPLNSNTLASGLESLEPTDNVATAIDAIAVAFTDYMGDASVVGVPAVSATLSGAPKSAMIAAMGGLNAPNGAALAISLGVTAFWTAMMGTEVAIWTMVPPLIIVPASLIIPVGLSGLQAAIQVAFTANTVSGATLPAAALTVASAIHLLQLGALVQTQVPPAPPVAVPVL